MILSQDTKNRISDYQPKMLKVEKWNMEQKEKKEKKKELRKIEQSLLPKSKRVKLGRPKIDDPKVLFPPFKVRISLLKEKLKKYTKSELRIKAAELIEML